MKTTEEKHISEDDMLSSSEMKMFETLKQNLQQSTPEPPEKIDSFIKAAARQRLKKQNKKNKTYFIFWSTGIAAVFAFSFTFLYLNSMQQTNGNTSVSTGNQTQSTASAQTAMAETNAETTDLAWNDMILELNDFSSELNDTDMEVSAFSAWDQNYAMLYTGTHVMSK